MNIWEIVILIAVFGPILALLIIIAMCEHETKALDELYNERKDKL